MLDINELLEKYRALLAENSVLRKENEILRVRLYSNGSGYFSEYVQ